VFVPLVGGLLLLALFVWIQRRSTHPALDVSLFRNPAFSAAAAALGLNFFALLGATFYLVFYLQGVRGFTPLQSGAALIPVALGMALMAPRSSGLAERFGAKAVCAGGFGLIALSFLGIQLLDQTSPVWLLVVVLSVQGLGMGAVMAPATESIMSVVPREKAGAGAAVNNSVRQVGGALGVAILGSVLAASYAAHLGPAVQALPAEMRETASQSIVATAEAIRRVEAGGDEDAARAAAALAAPARAAFVSAMHVTAVFTAGAAVVAAVVVLVWLPGRRRQDDTRSAQS
jgi:predicted MFS family arabinose efflux permease